MREIKVNIKSFTKEKLSRLGVPLKDKVELYKTVEYCCTRVENVIMSDFY